MAIGLPSPAGRRIALIAHDNKKQDMLEWAEYNLDLLPGHELFATATTGRLLIEELGPAGHLLPQRPLRRRPADRRPHRRRRDRSPGLPVGPAGAAPARPRRQGAAAGGGRLQHPGRRNRATADFLISSPLMGRSHQPWDPAAGPGPPASQPKAVTRIA